MGLSVSDVSALMSKSGGELVDAAADVVGKPRPTRVAAPVLSAKPVDLGTAAATWTKAAGDVQDHLDAFVRVANNVSNDWSVGSSAEAFNDYTLGLQKVIQNQHDLMMAISPILTDLQTTIQTSQDDLNTAFEGTAVAIGCLLLFTWGQIGAAIGAAFFTAGASLDAIPLILAELSTQLVTITTALITLTITIIYKLGQEYSSVNSEMAQIKADVSTQKLRAATAPAAPHLDGQSFGSINVPAGVSWH